MKAARQIRRPCSVFREGGPPPTIKLSGTRTAAAIAKRAATTVKGGISRTAALVVAKEPPQITPSAIKKTHAINPGRVACVICSIWTPLKILLLRPNRHVLLLRSANSSISYPVVERSKSWPADQNRAIFVVSSDQRARMPKACNVSSSSPPCDSPSSRWKRFKAAIVFPPIKPSIGPGL